jgi:hypothetical protein
MRKLINSLRSKKANVSPTRERRFVLGASRRRYVVIVLAGALLFTFPFVQPGSAQKPVDRNGKPTGNDDTRPQPIRAIHGRFRLSLNGFKVNHQTNQGLLAAWDAVTFYPNTAMVDASGLMSDIYGNFFSDAIGSTPEEPRRGGSASSRGGLQTGDGFPTRTPWQRSVPYTTGLPATTPPTIYFEGELVQNRNAALIIPSIWYMCGRYNLGLAEAYHRQIEHDREALGNAVGHIISGPQPLRLEFYLRPGDSMGLRNSMELAFGVPQNRPIGMRLERDQFGFIPQVLVLTYASADFMAHTDFGLGFGIVPVRYVDPPSFAGDYTLYFQVERLRD